MSSALALASRTLLATTGITVALAAATAAPAAASVQRPALQIIFEWQPQGAPVEAPLAAEIDIHAEHGDLDAASSTERKAGHAIHIVGWDDRLEAEVSATLRPDGSNTVIIATRSLG